ncbi:MAG: exosortase-associated EpsI family protein [Caldilineaceae bacterium]|nr:exosortase-associated EpsI family protein [Caldilineaceae bacterium]
MSNSLVRTSIVVALLFAALGVVYAPRLLSSEENTPAKESPFNAYVVDLDFWQRTPRETHVTSPFRFDLDADLTAVPLEVAGWSGQEMPETNEEVEILLEPEQYVRRLYYNEAGQYVWLTLIGGRSSRPFHAPDICYDADGWQYDLGSLPTQLNDGSELYGLWLDADKQIEGRDEPSKHIVYYFYLFPDAERDLNDGIVLFKLTSPQYGTLDETLAVQGDFIRAFFGQEE